MHSFLPPICPTLNIWAAARCLKRRNIRDLNFIGDSVSYQLAFTIACELGVPVDAGSLINSTDFLLRQVNLPVGLQLSFLWSKPTTGFAHDLARALSNALDNGYLQQQSLWMVNSGLWHTVNVCADAAIGCSNPSDAGSPVDKLYRHQLTTLFDVLQQRAHGHIVWRDSTAVHPGRMHRNVSDTTRRKFATVSMRNVRELNRQATQTASRYSKIHQLNHFFAATRERAGGTAPGDIRHWRADVLHLLLQISYLEWCELL